MKEADKKRLLKAFAELYPNPKSELNFKNQYQLLVSVMLSAQSTDKKVNEITPELFSQYPDFKALSEASLTGVEKIVRPINYYKTKAKHLIAMATLVVEQHGSRVPKVHEALVALPGVGNKTANVILSETGAAPALPVDTHVFRVSKRLGIASGSTPSKVEQELKEGFIDSIWRNLHHWLIFHGRRVCKAQRPLCSECAIQNLCPSKQ